MIYFLIFYCAFSYLFMYGAISTKNKVDLTDVSILLFSPISMPIYLGFALTDEK